MEPEIKKSLILTTLAIIFSLTGCGGGGDSAPVSTTTPDPAINSNWGQMEWDKGTWTN